MTTPKEVGVRREGRWMFQTVQSKAAEPGAETPEGMAARKRKTRNLLVHMAINVVTQTLAINASPKVANEVSGGDMAKGANLMGWCFAGTALFEFLLNPTIGCWTDDKGRKPAFLIGPIGVVISLASTPLPRRGTSVRCCSSWRSSAVG